MIFFNSALLTILLTLQCVHHEFSNKNMFVDIIIINCFYCLAQDIAGIQNIYFLKMLKKLNLLEYKNGSLNGQLN